MEKKTIKKLLKDIKNNNYAVPDGINPYDLSIEMMNYIGNTDSELRDDLILSILSKWIINDTLLINIIYMLLMIALDENHLLNGLGKINDTVFIRTFSAEIIAIIIYKHRQKNFLSEIDIKKVFNSILKFYNEDKDVRGFVDGKGW
ncbi:MAG: DUF2785 domain-containing protein, partial [Oscillospiraceae bacterium]